MASEQFGQRPFVAGSVFGVRSFATAGDRNQYLVGPMHKSFPYQRGETVAECQRADCCAAHVQLGAHRPSSMECSCGIYAYFELGRSGYDEPPNVLGIIEGYGLVTVGMLGFRCEQARIKALIGVVGERFTPMMLMHRGTGKRLPVHSLPTTSLAMAEWRVRAHPEIDDRVYPDGTRFVPRSIAMTYREVPVIASVDEAVAQFPLTVPEPVEQSA